MKKTRQSAGGLSFHGGTVIASFNQMVSILGEPDIEGGDKTNYEWEKETSGGNVFTIYDWKQARPEGDRKVTWNIGASNASVSSDAVHELNSALGSYTPVYNDEPSYTRSYPTPTNDDDDDTTSSLLTGIATGIIADELINDIDTSTNTIDDQSNTFGGFGGGDFGGGGSEATW